MVKRVSLDDRVPAGAGVASLLRRTDGSENGAGTFTDEMSAEHRPKFQRAAFSISAEQLEQLDVLHLELRRLGVQCSKSELVGVALEKLLHIPPNDWAALIVAYLSGSRRRG